MLKKCALIKIILIFLFPIDYVGCHEWYVHENSSFRLPTSILNEILFIYFHIPPFSLRCFLKSFADQESGFFVLSSFVLGAWKDVSWSPCPASKGKCIGIGNY